MNVAPTTTNLRVGLWGKFGLGNFGNEATLTSLLTRFKANDIEPLVVCANSRELTAARGVDAVSPGDPATGDRRGTIRNILSVALNRLGVLMTAFAIARVVDAMILAGTGPWEGLAFGSFDTPFEIWCAMIASRAMHKPFLVLDVGAEALPRTMARSFVRQTARFASYRSFRDRFSVAEMVANGARFAADDPAVADLAFGLPEVPRGDRRPGHIVVGVMDYAGRINELDRAEMIGRSYRDRIVRVIGALVERGHEVSIIGGARSDIEFGYRVVEEMGDLGRAVSVIPTEDPGELVRVMSTAETVVATRYHTLILGLASGTPVVSVGYSGKFASAYEQLGIEPLHRDINTFEPDDVVALVERAVADFGRISGDIDRGVAEARDRLEAQWTEVSSILTRQTGQRVRSSASVT